MALTDITSDATVYPSENQIETTQYAGSRGQEITHADYFDAPVQNHVESGFALPASDPDLTIPIPAGVAYIDGRRVEVDNATDVLVVDAQTNHIWLQLTFDLNGKVDGAQFNTNITGTPPSNAVKIGQAIAAAGAVTSTINGDRESTPYHSAAGLELVERKVLLAGATTVTFANLYGDIATAYKLIMHTANNVGAVRYDLQPNGISANQRYQDMIAVAAGVVMKLGFAALNTTLFLEATIQAPTGNHRQMISNWSNTGVGAVTGELTVSQWLDSTTVITSLDVVASAANAIQTDAVLALYRLRQ